MSEGPTSPKRVCIRQEDVENLPRGDLLILWKEQEMYVNHLEEKRKAGLASRDEYGKESEEKLKQQHIEAARRENTLVLRLTAKEQELQDYMNQIQELKQSAAPSTAQLRSLLLDPAINLVFARMKKEMAECKEKLEQTQNELSAWKFTPDSQTGKRLMAKCRMLLQENEELGKVLSSGSTAKLEGEIALEKTLVHEMKNSQAELDEFLGEIDEDVEGMQSMIYVLQQQLKEAKEQVAVVQEENLQLKTEAPILKMDTSNSAALHIKAEPCESAPTEIPQQHSPLSLGWHTDKVLQEHSTPTLGWHTDKVLQEHSTPTLGWHMDKVPEQHSPPTQGWHMDKVPEQHSPPTQGWHTDKPLHSQFLKCEAEEIRSPSEVAATENHVTEAGDSIDPEVDEGMETDSMKQNNPAPCHHSELLAAPASPPQTIQHDWLTASSNHTPHPTPDPSSHTNPPLPGADESTDLSNETWSPEGRTTPEALKGLNGDGLGSQSTRRKEDSKEPDGLSRQEPDGLSRQEPDGLSRQEPAGEDMVHNGVKASLQQSDNSV